MMFLKLILTNLRRHRVRTLIGIAGIAFSVAAMLTVVTILQGAIGMFERILSTDSEFIVFERNVSDLFFSSVPDDRVKQIPAMEPGAARATRCSSASSPARTIPSSPALACTGDDARIRDATWLAGNRDDVFKDPRGVVARVNGRPNFSRPRSAAKCPSVAEPFR